ncbi:MAG TPA: hypothetical protein VFO77_00350 [Actinoplanes sp.]|nr:hypothetical protein [Actinoplanes sp.]
MGTADEVPSSGTGLDPFAGDLFLALAAQGRLVVDAERADRIMAELRATMTLATTVAGQSAPGGSAAAMQELSKYVEALRVARRPGLAPGG